MANDNEPLLFDYGDEMPSDVESLYWDIPGTEPTADAVFWSDRFTLMIRTLPELEMFLTDLALDPESPLSAEMAETTPIFEVPIDDRDGLEIPEEGSDEFNSLLVQAETMRGITHDALIAQKAFAAELGFKALLGLSGQQTKRWQRLSQLHDLLDPIARGVVDGFYETLLQHADIPDHVKPVSTVATLCAHSDELLAHIRHVAEHADPDLLLEVSYHLDVLRHAIMYTIVMHKSQAELTNELLKDIDLDELEYNEQLGFGANRED